MKRRKLTIVPIIMIMLIILVTKKTYAYWTQEMRVTGGGDVSFTYSKKFKILKTELTSVKAATGGGIEKQGEEKEIEGLQTTAKVATGGSIKKELRGAETGD